MSLAWTTLAVLVLLLPGVLFFFGLYFEERASRETIQYGILSELAFVVFISLVVHAAGFGFTAATCGQYPPCIRLDYVFAALQLEGSRDIKLVELARNIETNVWWIIVYLLLTSTVGFLCGWWTGRQIIGGFLQRLAIHGWIYDVIPPFNEDYYIVAHVLTKIRQDDRVLIYRGLLRESYFTKDGKIAYLVLANSSRYYLQLKERRADTSPMKNWSRIGGRHGQRVVAGTMLWSWLVIEGEDIANVVFDALRLPKGILQDFDQRTASS